MKAMTLAVAAAALLTAACGTKNGNEAQAPAASAQQITGAGSTFVYPVLSAWAADYQKQAGTRINYQSIGSGGGIAQVKAGTVDFGATDQPLASDELAKAEPGAIPDRDRRHRRRREPPRPGARPAQAHRPAPRRHLCRQGQELERPGDRQAQSRREAAERRHRRRPSLGRLGHDASTSPIISARSARRGRAAPAKARPSPGRPASAARAMKALPATSSRFPNSIGYVEYAYVVQNGMNYAALQNAAGNVRQAERRRPFPTRPRPRTGRMRRTSTWS